jgi:calcineurin-like phosphoesterase family protein
MSRVFITSDLHLGHTNLVRAIRGFGTAEESDELIIKNWNKVITKRDMVYILGDIAMENHRHYHLLDGLSGAKVIVGGNHDLKADMKYLLPHVDSVVGCVDYKGFCLTHIPIHPSEVINHYRGNIHGHMHQNRIMINGEPNPRYFNVCLELNNYTPVLFTDIEAIFNKLPK